MSAVLAPAALLPARALLPVKAHASVYSLTVDEAAAALEEGGKIYGRVFGEGAWIYSDAALTSKLFVMPPTYYALVTSVGDSCRTVYCYEDFDYARAVTGYMSPDDLVFVDVPPTGRSFPTLFLKFEGNGTFYKNDRFDSFYSQAELGTDETFFYGYYPRGNDRFCYVLRDGKLGYYSLEVFEKFTLPPHADPQPVAHTTAPPDSASDNETGKGFFASDAGKAVFIAASCILAIAVMYLVFLPKKRAIHSDEEIFE